MSDQVTTLRAYLETEICRDHEHRPCAIGKRTAEAAERAVFLWLLDDEMLTAMTRAYFIRMTEDTSQCDGALEWERMGMATRSLYKRRVARMVDMLMSEVTGFDVDHDLG